MSAGALASKLNLPRTRIERIASEDVGITADTALRLGKALGTSPQLWLNLQNDCDLQIARREIGKSWKRSSRSSHQLMLKQAAADAFVVAVNFRFGLPAQPVDATHASASLMKPLCSREFEWVDLMNSGQLRPKDIAHQPGDHNEPQREQ